MENTILTGLVDHFGKDNAYRIYACALIMTETNEKAQGELQIGTRMVIGALKRIRRNGGFEVLSWAKAIDKLELEQDEGRHYSLATPSNLMIDVKRIEKANGSSYTSIMHGIAQEVDAKAQEAQEKKDTQAMAIAMIRHTILQAQSDYEQNEQAKAAARAWVGQYWETISKTKRTYLHSVIDTYNARETIAEDVRKNLSNRYAPKGVKPMEFVELLARYVA